MTQFPTHVPDSAVGTSAPAAGETRSGRSRWPLLATVHHPITKDRDLEVAALAGLPRSQRLRRTLAIRNWYRFLLEQQHVVRRLPHVVTVSESSRRDIVAQLGALPEAVSVVPGP